MASLGRLKGEHGCLDEAEEWFEQATADEFGCSEGWLWVMRGGYLAVAGRFEEAIFCHRQAAELPGNAEEAYLNIGYVLRAQGKYAEAIKAFQKALELTPDYPEAVRALGGLTDIFNAIDFASSVESGDLR
jgi:tetratricopeptide (TPR) repeat protein